MYEPEYKREKGLVLPVVVDTINGRDRNMRISELELWNNETLNSLRPPHLLSPEHRRERKELPY